MADARHDFLQTINRRVADLEMLDVHRLFQQHLDEGQALLRAEGITTERVVGLFQADMAYDGQIHEVRTPLPSGTLSRAELVTAFETSYAAQYGDTLGNRPIKVTTLRTTVIGVRPKTPLTPPSAGIGSGVEDARRAPDLYTSTEPLWSARCTGANGYRVRPHSPARRLSSKPIPPPLWSQAFWCRWMPTAT